MRKLFSKNKLTEFSPELHWDIILMIVSLLIVGVSIYVGYLYVSLNAYIVNASTGTAVGNPVEEVSLRKIVNIESVLVRYREKEVEYNSMLTSLIKKIPVPTSTTSASTTSTSTLKRQSVASSTVR